jgi:hypothetical protein
MSSTENLKPEHLRIGLCADCKHMKQIVSERGRVFYQCGRGLSDPEFPKYPRLPVLICRGYEPTEPAS